MCTPEYVRVSHSGSKVPLGQDRTFREPADFSGPLCQYGAHYQSGYTTMLEEPYCIRYAEALAAEDSFVLAIFTNTLFSLHKVRVTHYGDELFLTLSPHCLSKLSVVRHQIPR